RRLRADMALQEPAFVHCSQGVYSEAHFVRAAIDHETAPINPVHVGPLATRWVDRLPVWIPPDPSLVENVESSIVLLQPFLERGNGFGTITKQLLVCRRGELMPPGRLDVGFVPDIVGIQGWMPGDHFGHFAYERSCCLAYGFPIQAQSRPSPTHIDGVSFEPFRLVQGVYVTCFWMSSFQPVRRLFDDRTH